MILLILIGLEYRHKPPVLVVRVKGYAYQFTYGLIFELLRVDGVFAALLPWLQGSESALLCIITL